jgi:hypothetical protein
MACLGLEGLNLVSSKHVFLDQIIPGTKITQPPSSSPSPFARVRKKVLDFQPYK